MRQELRFLIVAAACAACSALHAAPPSKTPAPAAPAATPASASQPVNPIVLSNQMMITVMERIKGGNYAEARAVAKDMTFGSEKLVDTPTTETRSFSSLMGKKLYEHQLKKQGRGNVQVNWTQQPIADGYYFQAMISFQEGKPDEALDLLQKAIFWDPVRAAFHVERGFMLHHQKSPIETAQIFVTYLKALELADNPVDFAAALRGIGYLFVDRRNFRAGLACYLLSRRLDPDEKTALRQIDYIRSQAPGLVKEMDETKAAALLREENVPVTFDPIHVQIRLEIANELAKDPKKGKELEAILTEALRLDPNNPEVISRLAALKK